MQTFTEYLQQKGYSESSIRNFVYQVQKLLQWLQQQPVLPQYVTYNRLLQYIKIDKYLEIAHDVRTLTRQLRGTCQLGDTGQLGGTDQLGGTFYDESTTLRSAF